MRTRTRNRISMAELKTKNVFSHWVFVYFIKEIIFVGVKQDSWILAAGTCDLFFLTIFFPNPTNDELY